MSTDRTSQAPSRARSLDLSDSKLSVVMSGPKNEIHVATSLDGNIMYDTSSMPDIRPEATEFGSWRDPKLGNVYQMEGTVTNKGTSLLTDLHVIFEPAGCCVSAWNMLKLNDKDNYGFQGYWFTEGLAPGKSILWGGFFTTNSFKMVLQPTSKQAMEASVNRAA